MLRCALFEQPHFQRRITLRITVFLHQFSKNLNGIEQKAFSSNVPKSSSLSSSARGSNKFNRPCLCFSAIPAVLQPGWHRSASLLTRIRPCASPALRCRTKCKQHRNRTFPLPLGSAQMSKPPLPLPRYVVVIRKRARAVTGGLCASARARLFPATVSSHVLIVYLRAMCQCSFTVSPSSFSDGKHTSPPPRRVVSILAVGRAAVRRTDRESRNFRFSFWCV